MKAAQYTIVLGMMPAVNSNAKIAQPVVAAYNPGRKTSERAGDMFEEIGSIIDEGFDKNQLKVSFLSPFYSVTVNDLPDSAEREQVENPTSLARIRFVSSNVTDLVDALPDRHDESFSDTLLDLAEKHGVMFVLFVPSDRVDETVQALIDANPVTLVDSTDEGYALWDFEQPEGVAEGDLSVLVAAPDLIAEGALVIGEDSFWIVRKDASGEISEDSDDEDGDDEDTDSEDAEDEDAAGTVDIHAGDEDGDDEDDADEDDEDDDSDGELNVLHRMPTEEDDFDALCCGPEVVKFLTECVRNNQITDDEGLVDRLDDELLFDCAALIDLAFSEDEGPSGYDLSDLLGADDEEDSDDEDVLEVIRADVIPSLVVNLMIPSVDSFSEENIKMLREVNGRSFSMPLVRRANLPGSFLMPAMYLIDEIEALDKGKYLLEQHNAGRLGAMIRSRLNESLSRALYSPFNQMFASENGFDPFLNGPVISGEDDFEEEGEEREEIVELPMLSLMRAHPAVVQIEVDNDSDLHASAVVNVVLPNFHQASTVEGYLTAVSDSLRGIFRHADFHVYVAISYSSADILRSENLRTLLTDMAATPDLILGTVTESQARQFADEGEDGDTAANMITALSELESSNMPVFLFSGDSRECMALFDDGHVNTSVFLDVFAVDNSALVDAEEGSDSEDEFEES